MEPGRHSCDLAYGPSGIKQVIRYLWGYHYGCSVLLKIPCTSEVFEDWKLLQTHFSILFSNIEKNPSFEEKTVVLSHPLRNSMWEEINREIEFSKQILKFTSLSAEEEKLELRFQQRFGIERTWWPLSSILIMKFYDVTFSWWLRGTWWMSTIVPYSAAVRSSGSAVSSAAFSMMPCSRLGCFCC